MRPTQTKGVPRTHTSSVPLVLLCTTAGQAHLLLHVDVDGVRLRGCGQDPPAAQALRERVQHVRHGGQDLLRDDACSGGKK